ncbi:MAG: cell envelope integrity protein CreD [Deltaproteobacteria bacterium]|jgi:inner membrane protein|nr:cell envelope integrity protein CreD [Deltaproteobacteria bacterium]
MEIAYFLLGLIILLLIIGVLFLGIWLCKKIDFAALPASNPLNVLNRPIVKRLLCLVALVIILQWPLGQIRQLTRDRERLQSSVTQEIAMSWGQDQTMVGPFLVVPYEAIVPTEAKVEVTENQPDPNNPGQTISRRSQKTIIEDRRVSRQAAILPKTLDLKGRLTPETRARGVYEILVYSNALKITGSFVRPDLKNLDAQMVEVKWAEARLVVGLSDTRAFRGISSLNLGGQEYLFVPGSQTPSLAPTGFSTSVDLSGEATEWPFEFLMDIAGTYSFMIAPLAEKTTMELSSTWPHPSFIGQGLPIDREISNEGFIGRWSVPNLVRNYPQLLRVPSLKANDDKSVKTFDEYLVGVAIIEPVDLYSRLDRATKYAILFITLTLLCFFLFEVKSSAAGHQLHIGQYGLIGLALALFYLTLLALAEHIGFGPAYLTASALIVGMVAAYVASTIKRLKGAALIGVVLTLLYGILYVILRQEDLALLGGTALLIVALGALMLATRDLNNPQKATPTTLTPTESSETTPNTP